MVRASAVFLLFSLFAAQALTAQTPTEPVVLDGVELFRVAAGGGAATAAERAQTIQGRIEQLGRNRTPLQVTLSPVAGQPSTVILLGSAYVMTVTDDDARVAATSREELSQRYAQVLAKALASYEQSHTWKAFIISVLKSVGAWLLFVLYAWALHRALGALTGWLSRRVSSIAEQGRFRGLVQLLWERTFTLLLVLLRVSVGVVLLVQFSLVLSYTLGLFPQTAGVANKLFDYFTGTLTAMAQSVIAYLPSGVFVLVLCVIVFYVIRVLKILFRAIERGDITMNALHPDAAMPTYQLLRILVVIFALVVAFPYLPGGKSDAFKGVSIFIGVLLSLGSGSAMGNIVSGVVLTYMRPFRVGDRVQIADTIGDIIDKSLLVTRLRTIKNVEVTIPNSAILNGQVINYSAMAQTTGLILHTTVTIGYDAPWRTVHELMIAAALATEGILSEPRPFVLQTALNDFNVSYEINAYTHRPNEMIRLYSALHANIQEKFNAAGVEIMSPNYLALRDGNTVTIPEDQRGAGYRVPSFRVDSAPNSKA